MNDVVRQDISLKSRKDLDITGVKKVYSLDDHEFIIETTLGKMKVGGSNLEMIQLDIEKGVLVITGNINLIEYSDNIKTKNNKSSFVTKLFK